MDRIIKEFYQWCKSQFIEWTLMLIWRLSPFGEGFSIMIILSQIQSVPSFYWIPIVILTCYFLILLLNAIDKRQKSPFEIVSYGFRPASFMEIRCCESCGKTMSYDLHYRITIKNNGKKDIEQVSVLFNNRYAINEETKSKYCNITPGAVEYFVFYLAKDQKEIEVTVTGKNTIP